MRVENLRVSKSGGMRASIVLSQRDVEELTSGDAIIAENENGVSLYLDPDDMPPNPFYCSECGEAFSDGLESVFFDGRQYRHMRCARLALDGDE